MSTFGIVAFLAVVFLATGQYIPQQPLPGSLYNPNGSNGNQNTPPTTTTSTTTTTTQRPQPQPQATTSRPAPPRTTRPPTGTTKSTCQYTFQVPDPKGACAGTSAALVQKLDQVKHELDQTRFQYVAQNSMIQSTLAKIQSDTGNYISRVSSLDSDLKKLQQLVNSQPTVPAVITPGPGGSNNNSQYLNQVIHDTKDLLTKAVSDINNKIYNVSFEMQKNALEEAKLQSELEKQISQQSGQIAAAETKLNNLENILKNLQKSGPTSQPSTTPGATAPPSGLVNQLKSQISKLENEIKNADKTQQNQFKQLDDKTDKIKEQLKNQTTDINNIDSATRSALVRLHTAEKDVSDAKNNLTHLQKTIEPQIQIIAQEVSETIKNLTRMEKELGQVGFKVLNNEVATKADRKELAKLKADVGKLSQKTTSLNSTISTQTSELAKLSADVQALQGSTGNTPGQGSISKLVDDVKNQTETDIKKTQKDLNDLQKLVMTLLSQVTRLAQSAGRG